MSSWSDRFRFALLVAAVLAAFAAGLGIARRPAPDHAAAVAGEAGAARRLISVVGEGRAVARPDTAELVLGVERQAPTAQEAIDQNARVMDAVVEVLVGEGIPRDKIQTARFDLSAVYNYERQTRTGPELVGYRVSNTVRVVTDRVDQVGRLIDVATGAGANTVHGLRFTVRDGLAVQKAALDLAVQNARERADAAAAAAGVEITGILSVVEEGVAGPIYQGERMTVREAVPAGASPTPVLGGELEVVVRVRVEFSLD